MKKQGFFRKYRNDLLLFGGLLLVVVIAFLLLFFTTKPGSAVTVEENGAEIASFSLSEDRTFRIVTESGENLLVIRSGEAWIESADCRDKICVRRGKIRNAGETIVCLPHRIVVTVISGEGGGE